MTALAGLWRFDGQPARRDCERMLHAQQVYAPDPPASWAQDGLAMGRRLFRLLPEDRYDSGPVVSAGGDNVLVADLRLDNRDALQAALGLGADAALRSDAALLMAALEKWGEEAVDRLVGDFAFAFWNGRRGELLLARDFLGQRPLHFHAAPGSFAFASMPKGLHALEEIRPELDEDRVAAFLAMLPDSGTGSFFRNVQRIPPAHLCVVTPRGVRMRRYWNPDRRLLRLPSAGDYDEAVRESLGRAVASRLRGAEKKVGAHLSGGLDSGAIAATAARLIGDEGQVIAFTAVPREGYCGPVPPGRIVDEGPLAARVAALYPQMEHVLVRTGGSSPLDGLDRSFFLFESPIPNLCNAQWTSGIARHAAQRGLCVMLTGEMGNLSFSYAGMEWLPDLLASGRWAVLARQIARLGRAGTGVPRALNQTFSPFLPAAIWRRLDRWRGRLYDIERDRLLAPDGAGRLRERFEAAASGAMSQPRRDSFATRLSALQRTDVGAFRKGQLGGWGIDERDASADRRLVELCLSIPPGQYLRDGRPRALARLAFADRLPLEVIAERRRGLQAADWHEGLDGARRELAEELERLAALPAAARTLDLDGMRALIEDWPAGGWNDPAVMPRYRLALLRAVSAGHFIRKASGSNA